MLTVIIICVTLYLSVVTGCRAAIRIAEISHTSNDLSGASLAEMEKVLNDTYEKADNEAPANFDAVIKAIREVWDDED